MPWQWSSLHTYLSTVPIYQLFVLSVELHSVEWADSCDDLQEKN